MTISVRKTNDGSATLYNAALNEHYHSIHGALTESLHVFIGNGYIAASNLGHATLRVLEIGFGTGLNAALTAQASIIQNQRTEYVGLEPFPIDDSLLSKLDYENVLDKEQFDYFKKVHDAKWKELQKINSHFAIKKDIEKIQTYRSDKKFHLIYFDAFSPEKQEEMWTLDVLQKCYDLLETNGIFTTYCAKGQFKRNLKQCGFIVKGMSGPPNKREITFAAKI